MIQHPQQRELLSWAGKAPSLLSSFKCLEDVRIQHPRQLLGASLLGRQGSSLLNSFKSKEDVRIQHPQQLLGASLSWPGRAPLC